MNNVLCILSISKDNKFSFSIFKRIIHQNS